MKIKIEESFRIPGTDKIVEKGQTIEVVEAITREKKLSESSSDTEIMAKDIDKYFKDQLTSVTKMQKVVEKGFDDFEKSLSHTIGTSEYFEVKERCSIVVGARDEDEVGIYFTIQVSRDLTSPEQVVEEWENIAGNKKYMSVDDYDVEENPRTNMYEFSVGLLV